jgi:hypothetical protein
MDDQPSWYKLIHYWCTKRKPKGYGLTLPFLIGATEFSTIEELITEISNTETAESIILRFCGDREEYVLSLDDSSYPLTNHLSGQNNLLYDDEKIESFKTFTEVIEFLNKKYSETINSGLFSKNMQTNKWETFTSDDNDFITKALTE